MHEKFKLYEVDTKLDVEDQIEGCNNQFHFQQVAYSVNGNCLTQICFNCGIITTNFKQN